MLAVIQDLIINNTIQFDERAFGRFGSTLVVCFFIIVVRPRPLDTITNKLFCCAGRSIMIVSISDALCLLSFSLTSRRKNTVRFEESERSEKEVFARQDVDLVPFERDRFTTRLGV